ncbi:hypothetical protein DY000_02047917 [Brassica cretica]|uniref:Uncharacterized protein n=1 Tax=Brassica cretica TaxID=69181 RepID=A0ABQ7EP30_BRACR|nr:hypothetical protein DY000_02047917 [Brassica cretica]
MKWFSYGLREIALKSRRECMDSRRIDVLGKLDRLLTIEMCMCSVTSSDQAWFRTWSLRSDRAVGVLTRYVGTVPWACSVAT